MFARVANEITSRPAPRGRLHSSFYTVRVGFYYFYLTPASSNLCSTISRKLKLFLGVLLCRVRSIYGVGCFVVGKCRLIFLVAGSFPRQSIVYALDWTLCSFVLRARCRLTPLTLFPNKNVILNNRLVPGPATMWAFSNRFYRQLLSPIPR